MNNEKKLGLDSAFPVSDPNTALAMFNAGVDPTGMSKRFYAACQIAPSVITAVLSNNKTIEGLAKVMKETNRSQESVIMGMCYEYVDELLKQEQL